MDFYSANLLVLLVGNAALSLIQWRQNHGGAVSAKDLTPAKRIEALLGSDTSVAAFKKRFLPVYLLVFAADWLQGPYIYTMYKDEKGLSESTVAHLFTTGFLAAAISATFVGSFADRYGRRLASQFFCVAYSICCLTILSDNIFVLFFGRVLGGLSTTLLFSVIESWMVTEFHRQHLHEVGGSLKDLFGQMTTLNSVVAIGSGLVAQGVADFTGTQKAPFMLAVACLALALVLISKQWNENYGDYADRDAVTDGVGTRPQEKSGFKLIREDKRLWALTITSCFLEGSLYLWIFFKFPALRLSHQLAGRGTDLPFGMIFADLMCAMMLGSRFFTWYSGLQPGPWVVSPPYLLGYSLLVASSSFLIPVLTRNEVITFWCFCAFEVCCGVYFPTMSNLKEKVVHDGVRAKVYGVLRMPLNLFVVIGLGLTQDGDRHRDNMFMVCSAALAAAATAVSALLGE